MSCYDLLSDIFDDRYRNFWQHGYQGLVYNKINTVFFCLHSVLDSAVLGVGLYSSRRRYGKGIDSKLCNVDSWRYSYRLD